MDSLDARDGRAEVEGNEVWDDDSASVDSGSHVTYRMEEPGVEGDRTRPTMMQKLKEKASDYENRLKGKEISDKGEFPHSEVSCIPSGDKNQDSAVAGLQEGIQHGEVPTAATGDDVPAEVTRDYMSSVKGEKSGGFKKHFSGEGADEPTMMERIREKVSEAGNHMKGKKSSVVEDPHPELAYIPPQPQREKPGFFSRVEHKFGGQNNFAADAVPKGTGSSDVGTGYEEDSEESLHPE